MTWAYAAALVVLVALTVGLTSPWGVEHVWGPFDRFVADLTSDVPEPPQEGGRTGA